MTLISLCMICKNEEKVLERCLKSVQDIVDEIIIVDTGSTDGTVKIAEKYGANILHFKWNDDFSLARNCGLEKASGKWILVLDADEELHAEDGQRLRRLAEGGEEVAYFFQVLNLVNGGIDACPVLRFFRNHKKIRFEGRVHEQIIFSIRKQFGDIQLNYTDIRIFHYGYLDEIVAEKNKKERNFNLIKRQVKEEPENAFHRYNLAGEYIRLEQYEKALEQLRMAKKLCAIEEMAFGHLTVKKEAYCLVLLEKNEEAMNVLREETNRFPDYPDLYFAWGKCAYLLGKNDEAKTALKKALAVQNVPLHYAVDLGVTTYRAPFLLGQICEAEKEIAAALDYYRSAWMNKPDFNPAFYRYLVLATKHVEKNTIMSCLKQVPAISQKEIGIPILLQLLAFDCHEEGLYVIKRLQGKKSKLIELLKEILRERSHSSSSSLPVLKAFEAWLTDSRNDVRIVKRMNKEPLFKNIYLFLVEEKWDDRAMPSKSDWLLLQYGVNKANRFDDNRKVLQLFRLWRYLSGIDPAGKRPLGLSLCERAKELLKSSPPAPNSAIMEKACEKIPYSIIEMDLMKE